MTSKKYSREKRFEAAAAMVAHGNSLVVSDMTGIPGSTLRHWRRHDIEFQTMCQEIWVEFGEGIKAKLATIIDESSDSILDRLRHGDHIRDGGTGELVRLPIKGKDLAVIGAIAFDKLALAESRPTSIVAKSNDLAALAEKFKQLSSQWQEKQIRVIGHDETAKRDHKKTPRTKLCGV